MLKKILMAAATVLCTLLIMPAHAQMSAEFRTPAGLFEFDVSERTSDGNGNTMVYVSVLAEIDGEEYIVKGISESPVAETVESGVAIALGLLTQHILVSDWCVVAPLDVCAVMPQEDGPKLIGNPDEWNVIPLPIPDRVAYVQATSAVVAQYALIHQEMAGLLNSMSAEIKLYNELSPIDRAGCPRGVPCD